MKLGKLLCIMLLVWFATGCGEEQQVIIPSVPVDIRLNLSSQEAVPLRTDGGAIYLAGGLRGIIVYRKNQDTYLAFERACTFEPEKECSIVEIDPSLLFMIDKCCGSQFDYEGFPRGGPAPAPLRRYQAFLEGHALRILN
jgi:hypothetical protein